MEVPQNNGIFISTNSIPAVYYVAKIWAKNRIKIPKRPTIGYPGHINTINYKSSYAWALWNYTPVFFHFLVFSCLDCLCLFSWTFDSNALSLISFDAKNFSKLFLAYFLLFTFSEFILFFLLVCLQIMLALKNYSLKRSWYLF